MTVVTSIVSLHRANVKKLHAFVNMKRDTQTYLTDLDGGFTRFIERLRCCFGFAFRGSSDLPGRLSFTSGAADTARGETIYDQTYSRAQARKSHKIMTR